MNLSKNFTLQELIASGTANKLKLNNTPSPKELENLSRLATEVLQPIRDIYGKPILVTSGYRSLAVNKAVGGAKTSQHLLGEAADIKAKDGDNASLFRLIHSLIKEGKLKVGQLIWEYGNKRQPSWVHVSLPRNNGKPDNQVLYIGI